GAEQADDVCVHRQAPSQLEAPCVRCDRVEVVVAAPFEAEPAFVDGQTLGERPAQRIELVTDHPHAAASRRERASEAQDESLGPGWRLELRLNEVDVHDRGVPWIACSYPASG